MCQHCPRPPQIIYTLQDMNNRPQGFKGSATVPKKNISLLFFIAWPQFLEEKDFKFANSFRVIGYHPPRNLHIPWTPLSRWFSQLPNVWWVPCGLVPWRGYKSRMPGHHLHHDKKGQKQLEGSKCENSTFPRWQQLKYFWNFHPEHILTIIFQMGWHHQPVSSGFV